MTTEATIASRFECAVAHGDAEDLVAYRFAEMRVRGVEARIAFLRQRGQCLVLLLAERTSS